MQRTALARAARSLPSPSPSSLRLINSLPLRSSPTSLALHHGPLLSSTLLRSLPFSNLARRPLTTVTAAPSSSSSSSSNPPPPPPPNPDPSAEDAETAKLPLTQRVKALFRKHGWTALVIYLVLSALDFAATFMLVSAIGADRVKQAEDWVLSELGWRRGNKDGEDKGRVRQAVDDWKQRRKEAKGEVAHDEPVGMKVEEMVGIGEAQTPVEATIAVGKKAEEKGYSAYATTAVLAYAIHKTALLPFRVGVTVAITPRVVRYLQGWGWKIGYAGKPTSEVAAAAASAAAAKKAAKEAKKKAKAITTGGLQ